MTRAGMRRRIQKAATQEAKQDIIDRILKSTKNGKPSKKSFVLQFILDRKQNRFKERMNLDDIWYYLRQNKFVPNKIEITKYTRKSVKGYVQELCDLLGVRRNAVGIIAQAYATLYFRGKLHNIAIDELTGLKNLGAFVLIIEKEGIVEVLKPFADKYGIALVTSHGFLTENATDLSNLIKRTSEGNGNVAILTDYDISGLLIGLNIPDIPRIGVDFDTLRDLDYDPDDVGVRAEFEEDYDAVQNHWDAVQGHKKRMEALSPLYQELLSDGNLAYLEKYRIEINAVKTAVGAEKLWNFIMRKLHETFPTSDYNRAINVRNIADITPDALFKLNQIVATQVASILSESVIDYKVKLLGYDGSTKIFDDKDENDPFELEYDSLLDNDDDEDKPDDYGFIEVESCEEKMDDAFNTKLDEDKNLGPVLKKIEKLVKVLKRNNNEEDQQ